MDELVENRNDVAEAEDSKRRYGVKKLPGLFKKSYTEKKLHKNILDKLYIPQDREMVAALFTKGVDVKKPENYCVDRKSLFTKKEIKKYKVLAKQIKKQHGTVKFLPLIAVVAALIGLGVVVTTFKNPIAKKIVVGACQSMAGAKCEVKSVNVSFLSTCITINNLAVGNKNSVMKNLFEAEKIQMDFNFVQLLKGSFVVQNMECSGMVFNTDRTTSCEIKKKSFRESVEESKFYKSLKNRSDQAVSQIKEQAYDLLGGSDVDSIVANIKAQLKTPAAAQGAMTTAEELTVKWSAKPDELKKEVDEVSQVVNGLKNLDLSGKDKAALQSNLTAINNAITKTQELKKKVQSVKDEIKTDSDTISGIKNDIQTAVSSDQALASSKLTGAANLVVNSKKIVTSGMNAVGYDMLGKFYPYVLKLVNYGLSMKKSSSTSVKKSTSAEKNTDSQTKTKKTKQTKSTKKQGENRLSGTTYWYSTKAPKFVVNHALASGTGFSAELKDLSSNQDMTGRPAVLNASYEYNGIVHNATGTLDIRSDSSQPVVLIDYEGDGYSASFDGTTVAQKSGVPSLSAKANLNATLQAGEDGFSVGGSAVLNPLTMTSDGFENELVTKYYSQALSRVNGMKLGFEAGYSDDTGVLLDLSGNYADVIGNALAATAASIGSDAKNAALAKIQTEINSSSNQVLAKVKEFAGIEGDIDLQNASVDSMQKLLEQKKVEIENKLKSTAADAIINTVTNGSDVSDDTKSKASDALKKKFGL